MPARGSSSLTSLVRRCRASWEIQSNVRSLRERKERRSAKENERRDEIIVVKICVIKTTYSDKWANDKLQGYASVAEFLEIANNSISF